MNKNTTITTALALLFLVSSAETDEAGYHPDVGDFARIVKARDYKFPFNFGPTGATGWFYEREFVINGVDKGSPADAVLKVCDRIRAVNGRRFRGTEFKDDENDPRRVLGMGITESETEARGGKLVVTVWRDGGEKDLTITLAVLGTYSKTWPYDCDKSAKILHRACQWLADHQLPEGAFVEERGDGFALGPSLDGLLLLSSGDPRFLENARRLAHNFAENPGPNPLKGEKTGTEMWGWSYQAMFTAEYYLRTGDTYVLPYLHHLYDIMMAAEHQRGGWSHGFKNANYAVGGYINPVGVACLTALALMQEAGFELDQKDLEHCKLYFRRWSYGNRGIHYGDHKSPFPTKPGGSGTGKNALASVAFEVFGEQDTSDRLVLSVIDSYRHRDGCHTGPLLPLIWGPIGASRATPAEFRMFMDYWTWFHDLSRRWDGSFLLPSKNGGGGYTARGPVFTMGGQALVYALPIKKTRICGAKQSPFAAVGLPKALQPIKALADRKWFADAATRLDELLAAGTLNDGARSRARLMQESIATTLKSVEYTIAQIEENLKAGASVLARARIRNLENLLGEAEGKLAALKKEAEDPRHDKIAKAWQTYQQHRLASYVHPESFEIMTQLANDRDVGFVQARARRTLAAGREWPTYQDSFCSESIFRKYHPSWLENKKDPLPLAVMRLLSFGDGILWTTWATRSWLEKAEVLGEFPFSTVLAATSQKGPAKWRYQAMDEFAPAAGWLEPGFDDSAWPETTAPLLRPTRRDKGPDRKWDKKFLLMRRAFQVQDVGFDALRIKGIFHDEVDIYLNGRHVARVLNEGRKSQSPIDFDITSAGLPVLEKGRNVLAAKATHDGRSGGHVDIGVLGVRR